jgi:hypothetical protein
MHGDNNVCYCKGEERTTVPEPCAGPLPRDTDLDGEKPTSSVYRHWQAHTNLHGATSTERLKEALGVLLANNATFQEMENVIGGLSSQVKVDKNSADLIHSMDARGCAHSIGEYSQEVSSALSSRNQYKQQVQDREKDLDQANKRMSAWAKENKYAKDTLKDLNTRAATLKSLEAVEKATADAHVGLKRALGNTMAILDDGLQKALLKSDPEYKEDDENSESAQLKRSIGENNITKQVEEADDSAAVPASLLEEDSDLLTSNAPKSYQMHKLPQHQFDEWHKTIVAHNNLNAISNEIDGVVRTKAVDVSKAINAPLLKSEYKDMGKGLSEEAKEVKKRYSVSSQTAEYDRLRTRKTQAKAALASAQQRLADAESLLSNIREFSGSVTRSCERKSNRYNRENKERVRTIRIATDLLVAIEAAANGASFPDELMHIERELENYEKPLGKYVPIGIRVGTQAPLKAGKECAYYVKAGDSTASIAQKFTVGEAALRKANPSIEHLYYDRNLKVIYPPKGTRLTVPRNMLTKKAVAEFCKIERPTEAAAVPDTTEKSEMAAWCQAHVDAHDKRSCGHHGICMEKTNGMCKCNPGWGGPMCKTKLCHDECEKHGMCTKSGRCLCALGWQGLACHVKDLATNVERDPSDFNGLLKEQVKTVKKWDMTHRIEQRSKRMEMIIRKKAAIANKKGDIVRVKEEAAKSDKKVATAEKRPLPQIPQRRPPSKEHDNVDSIVRAQDAMGVVKAAMHEVHSSTIAGNVSDAEDQLSQAENAYNVLRQLSTGTAPLDNKTIAIIGNMKNKSQIHLMTARNDLEWAQKQCLNDCFAPKKGECNYTTGKCTCKLGFGGEDCSVVVDLRTDGDKLWDSANKTQWDIEKLNAHLRELAVEKNRSEIILANVTAVWDLLQERNISKLKKVYNDSKKAYDHLVDLLETRTLRLRRFEQKEWPEQKRSAKENIRRMIQSLKKRKVGEEKLKKTRVIEILRLRKMFEAKGHLVPDILGWEAFAADKRAGAKTQYYNTITEENTYEKPKQMGYRWKDYEVYINHFVKKEEPALLELPKQQAKLVRDPESIPVDVFNAPGLLEAKSKYNKIVASGEELIAKMKNDVAEATKLMTIAKAKMEAAKDVLTQSVSDGMEDMKKAQNIVDSVVAKIQKTTQARNYLEKIVLHAQMEKAHEYSRGVVEATSKFGRNADAPLSGKLRQVEEENVDLQKNVDELREEYAKIGAKKADLERVGKALASSEVRRMSEIESEVKSAEGLLAANSMKMVKLRDTLKKLALAHIESTKERFNHTSFSIPRIQRWTASFSFQRAEDAYKEALEEMSSCSERLEILSARLIRAAKTGLSKAAIAEAKRQQEAADVMLAASQKKTDGALMRLHAAMEHAKAHGFKEPLPLVIYPWMKPTQEAIAESNPSVGRSKMIERAVEEMKKRVEREDLELTRRKEQERDMKSYMAALAEQMAAMKKKLQDARNSGNKQVMAAIMKRQEEAEKKKLDMHKDLVRQQKANEAAEKKRRRELANLETSLREEEGTKRRDAEESKKAAKRAKVKKMLGITGAASSTGATGAASSTGATGAVGSRVNDLIEGLVGSSSTGITGLEDETGATGATGSHASGSTGSSLRSTGATGSAATGPEESLAGITGATGVSDTKLEDMTGISLPRLSTGATGETGVAQKVIDEEANAENDAERLGAETGPTGANMKAQTLQDAQMALTEAMDVLRAKKKALAAARLVGGNVANLEDEVSAAVDAVGKAQADLDEARANSGKKAATMIVGDKRGETGDDGATGETGVEDDGSAEQYLKSASGATMAISGATGEEEDGDDSFSNAVTAASGTVGAEKPKGTGSTGATGATGMPVGIASTAGATALELQEESEF